MRFSENQSPDFQLVPVRDLLNGKPFPQAPDVRDAAGKPLYRRGFRMMVKIGDRLAGDRPSVRELASNSFVMAQALDDLLRAWYEGPREEDKLPVVECKAWEEIKGAHGSNFRPIFTIKKVVDRPADLTNGHAAAVAATVEDDDEPDDFDDDVPFEE
jgi:hypothetical protein